MYIRYASTQPTDIATAISDSAPPIKNTTSPSNTHATADTFPVSDLNLKSFFTTSVKKKTAKAKISNKNNAFIFPSVYKNPKI